MKGGAAEGKSSSTQPQGKVTQTKIPGLDKSTPQSNDSKQRELAEVLKWDLQSTESHELELSNRQEKRMPATALGL